MELTTLADLKSTHFASRPGQHSFWNLASLRHVGETILVPEHVRITYVDSFDSGKLGRGPLYQNQGYVKPKIDREKGLLTLETDIYSQRGRHAKFVGGHEDGHIMRSTGNLCLLRLRANQRGYKFDFFTKEFAQTSDYVMYHALGGRDVGIELEPPLQDDHNLRELFGHIGGLIALDRAGADARILDGLAREINTGLDEAVIDYVERTL